MISFDNNVGSKEFATLPPLCDLVDSRNRSLVEVFNFSDGDIPGDVSFIGNGPDGITWEIGIEIKSPHDLSGSLDTGRLQGQGNNSSHGQLLRMLDYFDISILIYYGNYWPDEDGLVRYLNQSGKDLLSRIADRAKKINSPARLCRWLLSLPKILSLGTQPVYWHGLHNALSELQLLGIDIHRVNDKHEVAILISSLYHLFQKPWHRHKLLRTFNTSNPARARISGLARLDDTPSHIITCAKLIAAVDVIGYERGVAIARYFSGNIPFMINTIASSPTAIAEIEVNGRRIGPVVSQSVHRSIGSGEIDLDTINRMVK